MDRFGGADLRALTEEEGPAVPPQRPRDPVQILPEEVWLDDVFGYLKEDPRDILNLSEACAQFEKLLQREVDLSACRLEEVIPLLLKWLHREDIFNCRGICKRVRKTVDKVLDHLELIIPYDPLNLFPRLVPPQQPAHRFEWKHFSRISSVVWKVVDSVEKVEQLRAKIETRAVSTVVAKSLELNFPWTDWDDNAAAQVDPPALEFYRRSLAFLRMDMLRRQICHLMISDDLRRLTVQDQIMFYIALRVIIMSLPNLQSLACRQLESPFPYAVDVEGVENFRRYIEDHPLDPAPRLQKLEIGEWCSTPLLVPLFRHIFHLYGAQLKDLDIDFSDDHGEEVGLGQGEYHFPSLLCLGIYKAPWHWRQILSRIRAPQLKELCLIVPFRNTPPEAPESPIALLIQTVQQFPSISSFRLDWAPPRHRSDPVPTLEQLRDERHYNVKYLELMGYWAAIPIQFFTAFFPNLETFSVRPDLWERDLTSPVLDLVRRKRFQESSLWRDLPRLEQFRCNGYRCSRGEAEEFQNANL